MEAIATLTRESDHVQRTIAYLLSQKLAKFDHHRVLFKRSAQLPGGKRSKKSRQKYELRRFGEQTMDLFDAHTSKLVDHECDIVYDLAITRIEFEAMLGYIAESAEQYIEVHNSLLRAKAKGQRTKTFSKTLKELERNWSISPKAAYGVFQIVLRRLNAAREIYSKVFRAYARLLLNTATSGNEANRIDTIQDGSQGLWYAIQSFDHNSASALSTYARWWIRQQTTHRAKRAFHPIRPSPNLWAQTVVYERAKRLHESKYGSLEPDEIPAGLNLNQEQVDVIKEHQQLMSVSSLDTLISAENQEREGAQLTVQAALGDYDKQLEREEETNHKNLIDQLLSKLDPLTQRIICLHFGLWHQGKSQQLNKKKVLDERTRQLLMQTFKSTSQ
jgi:RNA polymerase sigma factor (sigma-70 family)